MLSRLAFFVATPALLFLTLADADPTGVLSAALVATAGSAVLCASTYCVVVRWWWRARPADLATGALAASYVNAGNLGIPVAVHVLGDASFVAPVPLFQVLVMAPVGLAVLAGQQPESASRWRVLITPVRTPVVIGCGLGLLAAASGLVLPAVVLRPVELTAGLAPFRPPCLLTA